MGAVEQAGGQTGVGTTLNDQGRDRKRRTCTLRVEPLEGCRLASGTSPGLPGLAVEHESLNDPANPAQPVASAHSESVALGEERSGNRLEPSRQITDADPHGTGLSQFVRYLNRCWSRSGIMPHRHDDFSQEVYLRLLEAWGHEHFHRLLGDIDRLGISGVLGRETTEGLDLFRAIDRVKMRARRERRTQSLDAANTIASRHRDDLKAQGRGDLHEAIGLLLGPREAALIDATLQGQTPAEIAARWGVAPKTVSNEKPRVLHKLRDGLLRA
jgi:hypothetical protein